MSSNTLHNWTWDELEAYHDGALDPTRRTALAAALVIDPALRTRLQCIARVDTRARQALLLPARIRRPSGVRLHVVLGPMAVAAGLLLAWRVIDMPRPALSLLPSPATLGTPLIATPKYQAIRVLTLGSSPAPPPRARSAMREPVAIAAAPLALPARTTSSLNRAYARRDLDAALDLIRTLPADCRPAEYLRLGRIVPSAGAARRLLDALPRDEQVTVCALWARDPHLEGIVFPRLAELSVTPQVQSDVRAVLADLARSSQMRRVLTAHQLLRS